MSRKTLELLRGLLVSQNLAVGAPDFAETVQVVVAALEEIDAALAALPAAGAQNAPATG